MIDSVHTIKEVTCHYFLVTETQTKTILLYFLRGLFSREIEWGQIISFPEFFGSFGFDTF